MSKKVTNGRDMFMNELSTAYTSAQKIASMIPTLRSEAKDPEVQKAYQQWEKDARQGITHIERVFEMLGTEPKTSSTPVIEGIEKEHQSMRQKVQGSELLELADISVSEEVTYIARSRYSSLAQMAKLLGMKEAEMFLLLNMNNAESMSKQFGVLSEKIGKRVLGQQQMTTQDVDVTTLEPGEEIVISP